MSKNKLSIIVPIYGVERYLTKCIESLLNQAYSNVEIILVDDGSKDNCPSICDKYAAIDNRIVTIHKENGGQGSARNCGLEIATGEYIAFVDADDYVSTDMYIRLVDAIEKTNADIAVCGSYFEMKFLTRAVGTLDKPKLLKKVDALKAFYTQDYIGCTPWNKVYKRKIWMNLRFPENHYREDEWIFYQVLSSADIIYHIGVPTYHYILRKGSSDRKAFSLRNLEALDSIDEQSSFIFTNYPELSSIINDAAIQRRITILNELAKSNNYNANLAYVDRIVDYLKQHEAIKPSLQKKVDLIVRNPLRYIKTTHLRNIWPHAIKQLLYFE